MTTYKEWALNNQKKIEACSQELWNYDKCGTWRKYHQEDDFSYHLVVRGNLCHWGKDKELKLPSLALHPSFDNIILAAGQVLFPNKDKIIQECAGVTLLCGLEPKLMPRGLTYNSKIKGFRNLKVTPLRIKAFSAAIEAGLNTADYFTSGLELGDWSRQFENLAAANVNRNRSAVSVTEKPTQNETIINPLAYSSINEQPVDQGYSEALNERIDPFLPVPEFPLSTPNASDIGNPNPDRIKTTVYRILRDTSVALAVKKLHEYQCQICQQTITLPDGSRYAEAHHIQPLGDPHAGPDILNNVICVCPNHHAELDYGVRRIDLNELHNVPAHIIDSAFVEYHNQKIYSAQIT